MNMTISKGKSSERQMNGSHIVRLQVGRQKGRFILPQTVERLARY
jgi:hypothetical protein